MQPSILTSSGRYFDFIRPDLSLFDIHDIAHALSNLCRFTGHVRTFYSVAQHSVGASYAVPPEFAFEALMHDAAEAFVGDVSSPLKHLLPGYREIESRVESAIRARFGLPAEQSVAVKHSDLVMLATEKRDLMPAAGDTWPILRTIRPLAAAIVPLDPGMACHTFLYRFAELA